MLKYTFWNGFETLPIYTKGMKAFLIICIFIFTAFSAEIDVTLAAQNINAKSALCIDKKDLSFNEVRLHGEFKTINDDYSNLGILKKGSVWIRLPFRNSSTNSVHRYLEMENLLFNNVTLYNEEGLLITERLQSPNLSQSTLNPTYVLEFAPHTLTQLYLKIENHKTTTRFTLDLKSAGTFIDNSIFEITKIVFVLGFIVSLMLYNILVYFYTRDVSYLFYVFYIFAVVLQQLSYVGVVPLLFSPEIVELSHSTWAFQVGLMYLSASLYARRFLLTDQNFPRLDKVYKLFILLAIVEIPLFGTSWFYLPEAGLLTGLVFVFFNTFSGIYVYFQGNKQARFYALAWSMLIIGYVIIILDALGVVSVMYQVPNLILYLTGIEALILSLAFSDRYIILQGEKQDSEQLLLITLKNREVEITKEIKERTEALSKALSNNKTLFKELQHRTKNNLQLILSLIRMQASKLLEGEQRDAFDDLENRIRAIAKTHEILYHKDDLELIDMNEYFDDLLDEFEDGVLTEHDCNIELDIYAYIPLKEAIYLGLIINEMISNTIKYALKEQNNYIEIYLHRVKGKYILSYKDSGEGFDQEKVREDALGLSLIKTLVVEQLEGELLLYSNHGTEYIIALPI